ncbi:FAD:protein FMN transferase [Massilia sp. erpn]|uniref:FAD:protein FMN transferase n=1 Tax=Massilia sp. erpn TaxID=2738142 RepID=UPI002104A067|nr:FAD:protein FMN transferase [Massilia sp. erpn]UTY58421.1 FAD:protein FMN transferase [Massilia sp. erpn]
MRRVLLPHHISPDPAPAAGVLREFSGASMGTSWSVRLVEQGGPAPLQEGLQQQLDAVVAEMSHWEADSDLGRFNRAAAGNWQSLPVAFYEVLSFAMNVARDSGGAYDPCAGALVNLWGFGPGSRFKDDAFAPPAASQVQAVLAQRAGQGVKLDQATRAAWQPGGVQLDLSAVAKGYGVDRLAEYLEAQGIRHYLVEVGGELRGAGVKPDGQPWWVALEQVGAEVQDALGLPQIVVALHGLAIATSGDYRRFFQQGGQRYSHTIDPRSGAPIENSLASVSVVHAHCMAADAWSTALTVLGLKDGLALAESRRLAVRFVAREGEGLREYMSSHFRAMLEEE